MKSVVIGTAGHIDHGKSALVRALTGTDPDRLKEEKARGITIDLGFANAEIEGVNLAFVDVPGHERFVKNMLAGAGGVDLVMLVVAADESVMPQTREHFQICRLLRVPGGLVVLTKSDLAEPDMLELARMEVRELTAGSFLDGAPIVPVSSTTGEGLDELRRVLAELARDLPVRPPGGAPRLPVDRVFSVRGFGTVVTGTLVSGELREGTELVALPRGLAVKVRGLQVHGRTAVEAHAGQRVAVNLGGAQLADLARGDTLTVAGSLDPTQRLDASIDLLADARPLKHGARIRFHHGTTELLGRVAVASVRGTATTSEVPPGGAASVRVRLERPAVVTRGDRFIMRAYSPPVTIGGGVVLDPRPPRAAIRTPSGAERFARIDIAADPERATLGFVVEREGMGFERSSLVSRAGLAPGDAERVAQRLVESGQAMKVGELLVATSVIAELSEKLVRAIEAHHRAEPLSDGIPREEARERIFGHASPAVFERVVGDLAAAGRIIARDRLAMSFHRISLSGEDAAALESVGRVYRDAGLAPPDAAGAAVAAGVTASVADRVTKLLVRQKTLVKLDVLLFHADALARLKDEVRGLKRAKTDARIDVAAFKERYGVSRKFAIPLLEYLDRERVTRRVGDARVVL